MKDVRKLIHHQGAAFVWIIFLLLAIAGVSISVLFRGNLSSLLAAATSSLARPPVSAYFSPESSATLPLGSTKVVTFDINSTVPINAVGVTLQYPKDSIEIVELSKAASFLDLWTEDTVIKESSGEIHFSGGSTRKGGVTGAHTALTITLRATRAGESTISVEDLQAFASDGKGTLLQSESQSLTLSTPPPAAPVTSEGGEATGTTTRSSLATIPGDVNGDGHVTLIDISIMLLHMMMPYDSLYDLNHDGSIGLSDLSIVFTHLGL